MVELEEPGPALTVPGAAVVRTEARRQWLRFHRDHHTVPAILAEVALQAPVRDLTIEDPPTEEIVRRIYDAPRR